MTKVTLDQKGVAHILLALVVLVVVAAIAFAAWRVLSGNSSDKGTDTTTAETVADEPDAITSQADVDGASRALDEVNIDEDLDSSEFEADINDLL